MCVPTDEQHVARARKDINNIDMRDGGLLLLPSSFCGCFLFETSLLRGGVCVSFRWGIYIQQPGYE